MAGRREENTPYHHHPHSPTRFICRFDCGGGCGSWVLASSTEHVDVWHAGLMAARCIRIAVAAGGGCLFTFIHTEIGSRSCRSWRSAWRGSGGAGRHTSHRRVTTRRACAWCSQGRGGERRRRCPHRARHQQPFSKMLKVSTRNRTHTNLDERPQRLKLSCGFMRPTHIQVLGWFCGGVMGGVRLRRFKTVSSFEPPWTGSAATGGGVTGGGV